MLTNWQLARREGSDPDLLDLMFKTEIANPFFLRGG